MDAKTNIKCLDKIWSPIRNRKLVTYDLCEPLKYGREIRFLIKADLFHDDVPNEWIDRIFAVMALAPQHTFQILTKRPERMLAYFSAYYASTVELPRAQLAVDRCAAEMNGGSFHAKGWPLPNVWLGVSCEDQKTADERIPLLLETPAAVRFVSYEPALGPVEFGGWESMHGEQHARNSQRGDTWKPVRTGIDLIIVGGESGPRARPFDIQWARSTVKQCKAAGVAVFVKQMGRNPYRGDIVTPQDNYHFADRAGADPSEWPEDLRIREFPKC